MTGKIIKGIAGFYYVIAESGIYECKPKGIFRKEKRKPLVGDNVEFEILDPTEMTGSMTNILPRKNELIRPAVVNVDQAMVIFALESPKPNIGLLDRFLLTMEWQHVPAVICFNKEDLADQKQVLPLTELYRNCGYEVFLCSVKQDKGLAQIRMRLQGKTTVVSGPSGVGKSSVINAIQPDFKLKTGEISDKLKRGKHTTRHVEIYRLNFGGYIVDTPGFSSFSLAGIGKFELKEYYPEINKFNSGCRFMDCLHYKEPGCVVKDAVNDGLISRVRYNNYIRLLEEIQNMNSY